MFQLELGTAGTMGGSSAGNSERSVFHRSGTVGVSTGGSSAGSSNSR